MELLGSAAAELEALGKQIEEARKRAAEALKPGIKAIADELFASCPDVLAFGWTQYTPYFNDGDPCVFSVGEPTYKMAGEDYEDDDDRLDSIEWAWAPGYSYENGKRVISNQTLYDATQAINRAFGTLDDEVFRAAFGDHSQVIVTPTEIIVQEYDHD